MLQLKETPELIGKHYEDEYGRTAPVTSQQ